MKKFSKLILVNNTIVVQSTGGAAAPQDLTWFV